MFVITETKTKPGYYAFVTYYSAVAASQAKQVLNGAVILGDEECKVRSQLIYIFTTWLAVFFRYTLYNNYLLYNTYLISAVQPQCVISFDI